ncbi:MAG: LysE family transporter, partial [Candidatus Odinarchaeota archaeon]|nr:LysE family transporter [Candidatus Odinarchaeota archaeon]
MHIIRSDLDNIYIHITFSVVHELLLALEGFIMLPIAFVFKVVSVTSSGVLSPGPLTASTVAVGTKDGARAGLLVSIGHTIVEFPLVILIAFGITIIFTNELATRIISLLGAGMLFFLSYLM